MRRSARSIEDLVRCQPWLVACVLLLLASALILPSLHHLVAHQHNDSTAGDCPVCLLLNHAFLALPIAYVLTLFIRVGGLFPALSGPVPATLVVKTPGARAPPLSN